MRQIAMTILGLLVVSSATTFAATSSVMAVASKLKDSAAQMENQKPDSLSSTQSDSYEKSVNEIISEADHLQKISENPSKQELIVSIDNISDTAAILENEKPVQLSNDESLKYENSVNALIQSAEELRAFALSLGN